MAQVTISQLPAAQSLTGTESVPISQNGQTVQTTVAAIANSPTQTQTFVTVNSQPTLPNSRQLQGGTGVGLTDTGSLGTLTVSLNGVSGSLEISANGMIAKTGGSVVGRTLTGSSTGVTVTNGDGVAGNPVIALTGAVGSINGLSGSGLLTLQNGASVGSVTIQGTANQIDVADGDGLSGSPTIAIASNPTIPGTGGMVVPVGTTAQRGAAVNGTIRYNTDISQFEIYDNGWGNLPAGAVSSVDVSGGTTGLTTSGGPITSSGTITIGGTLNTTSGGTGLSSYTAGDTLYYAAGSALSKLAIGSSTHVLTSSGTAPQWTDPATMTVGTATSATNVSGGTANQLPVQTGVGTTGFVVAPTVANTYLEWSGSAFQWSANPLGTVTSVGGTGTVSGITLTGTVTTSGNLTLGGSLDLSSPPAIGGTAANSITGTTITANTQFTGSGAGLTGTATGLSIGGNAATATAATNVAGGTANQIVFNTGAGASSFITAPTVANTFLEWSGSAFQWSTAGAGTVTSVGLSLPAEFTISNSPVTGSGTLTGAWANATANYVFAGPTTGAPGTPTFRAVVAADIPTLNQNTTGSAGSVANSVTFTNTGGAAAGATFDGSAARTIDYSTVGAPKADGTGASGTWGIDITGTATNATNVATTATATNADFYIPFVAASTTSNQALGVDAGITYNPSTNAITAGISGGTF